MRVADMVAKLIIERVSKDLNSGISLSNLEKDVADTIIQVSKHGQNLEEEVK
jgi:hypothetical protein